MRKVLFLSLWMVAAISNLDASAVTYDRGGGRFGDQCLGYLHAKWISYYYGIPFFYRPFPYSDLLALHTLERPYEESDNVNYDMIIQPEYGQNIDFDPNISALYIIPYFPEPQWERTPENRWYYFAVDWNDSGFKKKIKKLFKSVDFKPKIKLPKRRISVAVHVRLGGGFDDEGTRKRAPLKLPPLSYYKEQIKRIYELLNQKALYVHVFTDDQDPQSIMKIFQKHTKGLDIKYGCRLSDNSCDQNVLEDFFEMTRFECLIRPDSNYSIVASKISDFKIVISPLHFKWIDENQGYVDEVQIEY